MQPNPQDPNYIDPWKLIIKNRVQDQQKLLIEGNFDINSVVGQGNGMTLLMIAVSEQKLNIIQLILQHPLLNIDQPDFFGKSALHYAAANGDHECIEVLVNAGGNINLQNRAGESPLFKACFFVEKNTIQYMQTNIPQINITLQDVKQRTALDVLKINQNLCDGINSTKDIEVQNIIGIMEEKIKQMMFINTSTKSLDNIVTGFDQELNQEISLVGKMDVEVVLSNHVSEESTKIQNEL